MDRMNKGLLIAAASATLLLNEAVQARSEDKVGGDKVKCYAGINECRRHGSCASPSNSFAGKNECKGKGFLSVSKVGCERNGGRQGHQVRPPHWPRSVAAGARA